MPKFTNPYHFVPVEKAENREHWLKNTDFDDRELKHYSHAKYHPDTYSGRIICRLTTEKPMFVGASSIADEHKKEPAEATPFELNGQPTIPASTLRGLLSSIAETASNSALRVLHDKVLSYRRKMTESLSALGMVVIKENDQGEKVFYLKPLTLPTLGKAHRGGGFSVNTQNEAEKTAYAQMFGRNARLKVYINDYRGDRPVDFLAGKQTYSPNTPEFYYARLDDHHFDRAHGSLVLNQNNSLYVKHNSYVIGKKTIDNSTILTHQEWDNLPIDKKRSYTRGILRVLGKRGRDMPDTKKHELFIPFPPQAENWNNFPILPEAIERFHQLADERTNEDSALPYEPIRTKRNDTPHILKEELAKKGLKNGENALRLKHGDLVYFRPTLKDDNAVVAEIAFSSIWRERVEDDDGENASVHRFFYSIDPELLPFHKGRNFISPAELLFGFTQKDEDEKGKKKEDRNVDGGRALAGRVQISFGKLAPEQELPNYQERVLLKSLLSPKLPCPMMYFKNRYNNKEHKNKSELYIHKSKLKRSRHKPQGRKMYVHSHHDNGTKPWKSLDTKNNQNLKTYVTPVRENTEFYFHVDFNNLSEWELGMLCYALRPTDEFRHKLGMGKSIGLGRVRIDPVGLFLIDREQRYRTTDIFNASRYHAAWIDEQIQLPANYANEQQAVAQTETFTLWENLRNVFRETISPNVRNALELLGNPDKVTAAVHTPQVAGRNEAELEQENFKWFVQNEQDNHEMLEPLDENSTKLPTFRR